MLVAVVAVSCNTRTDQSQPARISFTIPYGDSLSLHSAIDTSHALFRRYLRSRIDSLIQFRAEATIADSHWSSHTQWMVVEYTSTTRLHDVSRHWAFATHLSTEQAAQKRSLDFQFSSLVSKYQRQGVTQDLIPYVESLRSLQSEYRLLEDTAALAAVHSYLAHAFYDHNDLDPTAAHIDTCLDLCQAIGLVELEANVRFLRAKLLSVFFADYAAADKERYKASAHYTSLGLNRRRISISAQWAYVLHQLHEPHRAIPVLNQALHECERFSDLSNQAYCTNLLAECLLDIGQVDSALSVARTSLELSKTLADSLKLPYYQSSLAYATSTLGILKAELGNPEMAQQYFARADSEFTDAKDDRGRAVNAGRYASFLLNRGELARAHETFESVLRTSPKFESQVFALYGLATCYHLAGEDARAQQLLQACIDRYEVSRSKMSVISMRTGMLSDKIGFYNLLGVIQIERYRRTGERSLLDSALATLERSRAQTLLDQLAYKSSELSPDETDLIQQISEVQTTLLLNPDTDSLAQEHLVTLEDSLQRLRLADHHSSTPMLQMHNDTVTLDRIQQSLRHEDVLIEYLVSSHGCYAITVSPGFVHVDSLSVSAVELQELISSFVGLICSYPSVDDLNAQPYRHLGDSLRRLIWPSCINRHSRIQHVLVAASGALHQIPFETLPDEDGIPLVSTWSFSYPPSFTSLSRLGTRASLGHEQIRCIAFGNPVLPFSTDLPPLPNSQTELTELSDIFGANGSVFSGSLATKATLRQALITQTDILHFATHAVCNPSNPNRSALVLSYDSADIASGFMHTDELRQLDLGAALVFLSACRSADGRFVPGEGLIGLGRTFLESGARAVIGTRWSVNDRSSAEFVRTFYTNLMETGSAHLALCAAKRQMITSRRPLYRHPYFWAAYTLIGSDS